MMRGGTKAKRRLSLAIVPKLLVARSHEVSVSVHASSAEPLLPTLQRFLV